MSGFINNTFKLLSGNIVAQILCVILIPIITRLYTPGDYGVFQLFISISSVITIFSCFSYQLAIMLPEEDEESINIVALCLILILIVSIISGAILLIISSDIGKLLNSSEISSYLVFIPITVFLSGIFSVLSYWMARKKKFGTMATAHIVNSTFSRIIQVGLGLHNSTALGLIIGQIIGHGSSLIIFIKSIKNDSNILRFISINKIKRQAIRYKRFPIYTSWSTTANTISTQITPITLAFFFNSTTVGYYALANMVIFLPISFFGQALGNVFFQKASEEKNKTGEIVGIVKVIISRLIAFGLFPSFVIMIMGGVIFSEILGPQWSEAGIYAGILAPWTLFVFIASPLSTIFAILEKQTIDLLFNILILFSRLCVLIIGGLLNDPIISLLLYSITGVVFWGWMNTYLLMISGVKLSEGLLLYVKPLFLSIILSIPMILINYFQSTGFAKFLVIIAVSIIYYTIIIKRDALLCKELNKLLQNFHGIRYLSRK
ncbi:lipopolysaccharide biosynthesis protein [Methanospirillum sp.]|uniref:lipopolysaccharide biosynthesis protein n=1 Tax=Methanospirillum sp. TaxID=45200 RepID=UPI001BD2479D|nr:lipopolysaccharide biosynthesis protein [Methanospirillum sp.]